MSERDLEGLRVVVCRPRDQAASLAQALATVGAEAIFAPVITIADPRDGGAELRAGLAGLGAGDWLVLTSPNGVTRAVGALEGALSDGVRVAVVGPGTAERARSAGLKVDLVPRRSIAEGLLDVFPRPGQDGGGVVLARAAVARDVLPKGLREMGWRVTEVVAYETVASQLTAGQRRSAATADAVMFTSSSTVDRLVTELGTGSVPPLVVSIGPATSETARAHGLEVTVEAGEQTVDGLVAALVNHARGWR